MATAPPLAPRTALTETVLVLGVSLGASAVWSALSLVRKLTAEEGLSGQVTSMNQSVTPDQPHHPPPTLSPTPKPITHPQPHHPPPTPQPTPSPRNGLAVPEGPAAILALGRAAAAPYL